MCLAVLTTGWHSQFSPHLVTTDQLSEWAHTIRAYPFSPVLFAGVYVAGSLILFPVTLMIVFTALVYPFYIGIPCALTGCLMSAILTYEIGAKTGKHTVRYIGGPKLNRLSRRLAHRGVLAVMIIRHIPVAPFTIINILAGASHIKRRDFLLGTLLGMLPSIVAVNLFTDHFLYTLDNPKGINVGINLILIIIFIATGWLIRKAVYKKRAASTVGRKTILSV
jgi:uncharacterized membrane protein YdjX (TVP38/TMEM64 family)